MVQNRERCIVSLMNNIRFPLISPADLVQKVQSIDVMMNIKELREMVLEALNYHVVPHSQPLHHTINTHVRSFEERLISGC